MQSYAEKFQIFNSKQELLFSATDKAVTVGAKSLTVPGKLSVGAKSLTVPGKLPMEAHSLTIPVGLYLGASH